MMNISSIDDEKADLRKSLINEKNSITCFEDLSNDLLLEIFDYFDGFKLWEAFINLNTRFEQLLTSSSFSLKITSASDRINNILPEFFFSNRHRIISLHLQHLRMTELFFDPIIVDPSFYRLESIHLSPMPSEYLEIILQTLTSLPRLFSLDLSTYDCSFSQGLGEVYQLILRLPVLKYNIFSAKSLYPRFSLSINTSNQYSTIESITINHPFDLHQLLILLSYTPRLRRLICRKSLDYAEKLNNEISIALPNLRYIVINECYLNFDVFERFIMQICSQLRVMHIAIDDDPSYLDANRWEQLISRHIPFLHKLHLNYIDDFVGPIHIAQSISSFLIE